MTALLSIAVRHKMTTFSRRSGTVQHTPPALDRRDSAADRLVSLLAAGAPPAQALDQVGQRCIRGRLGGGLDDAAGAEQRAHWVADGPVLAPRMRHCQQVAA